MFGVELPIIQAPMAGVQGSALTIAVCNAGGLGSLPCGMLSPDEIRAELALIRDGTDKPFNINFFCHNSPEPDAEREARWRDMFASYYREFGIDPQSIAPAGSRTPFNEELAETIREFEPPVISFHFGLPDQNLLERVRAWCPKIIASATTVEEARWLQANGADAVIAQGVEAGGHRGMFLSEDITTQVGTLALVPQIVQAIDLPVIAAGGIANPRAVRAAMELGASGVQAGTAYLLCAEANTSAVHREALKSESVSHTALTNLFSGRPARAIVNRIMRELGPMNSEAPAFPRAGAPLAPLRAAAEKEGSGDFSPLWCGQNARGCREASAAEVTRELVSKI